MGQKIHPIGYRLVTTNSHNSLWYSKISQYKKFLNEDISIRTHFKKYEEKFLISKIKILRSSNLKRLKIIFFTANFSLFSDENNLEFFKIINKIKKKLQKLYLINVSFKSLKNPNSNAAILSFYLGSLILERIPFKRACKKVLEKALESNILGIKIQVSGRLNGAEMARTEWVKKGPIPLHTLRADIDFHKTNIITIYGLLGIKIWIYKGQTL